MTFKELQACAADSLEIQNSDQTLADQADILTETRKSLHQEGKFLMLNGVMLMLAIARQLILTIAGLNPTVMQLKFRPEKSGFQVEKTSLFHQK